MFLIKTDDKVTKNLDHCLYCVIHEGPIRNPKLVLITDNIHKCPMCNRIYILGKEEVK
jgi:hypothetical protein